MSARHSTAPAPLGVPTCMTATSPFMFRAAPAAMLYLKESKGGAAVAEGLKLKADCRVAGAFTRQLWRNH
ncbi:MAG: hypothetical protein QOJ76_1654 [Acidobacteriota bacterium]|nr:hypothetical protein [Acidobacteriota bacterium]